MPSADSGTPADVAPNRDAAPAPDTGPALPETGRVIGDPCTSDAQCSTRSCLRPSDGFPDGHCTVRSCRSNSACDRTSECVQRPGTTSFCGRECDEQSDCRPGYDCVVDRTGQACVPSIFSPSLRPVCESELLEFNAAGIAFRDGFRALNTHRISFEIPQGTTSFLVAPWDRNGFVYPVSLTAPDGRVLDMIEYAPLLFTSSLFDYIAPLLMPATPAFADWVMPGEYSLIVGWNGTSSEDLCHVLLTEQASAPSVEQKLQVTYYLTGAAGLTAENAGTSTTLSAITERVAQILGRAGIAVLPPRIRAVPADLAEQYRVIRNLRNVQDLCEFTLLPEGGAEDQFTLNVMLVDVFTSDLEGVLGISSGIMGGAASHGSSGSCVVFGMDPASGPGGAEYVGLVMAHEIGHYLGLFHTSEASLELHDPLTDTPQCIRELTWDYDQCPDYTNLMFPFAYEDNPAILSPQQGDVMRANPLTRP